MITILLTKNLVSHLHHQTIMPVQKAKLKTPKLIWVVDQKDQGEVKKVAEMLQ